MIQESNSPILSEWTITGILGRGGFKVVYKIENRGKVEALKVTALRDPSVSDPIEMEQLEIELLARSDREYKLIQQFGGECVVLPGSIPGHETTWNDVPSYIYSEEFLPGQTLDKFIRQFTTNGQVPLVDNVKALFRTGIDVLERLWAKKIVHRDIKPQNIMVWTALQRPFVFFDLGIAFDLEGKSLTQITLGPGTLRYRAPETLDPQYRASIDVRSDLFSLAATVYEFATGIHPIHHGSINDGETVYRLLKLSAKPLASFRPDLPRAFCDLIDRCLRKKPALRPIRFSEIRAALEAV